MKCVKSAKKNHANSVSAGFGSDLVHPCGEGSNEFAPLLAFTSPFMIFMFFTVKSASWCSNCKV
jgi:hypothetical protein